MGFLPPEEDRGLTYSSYELLSLPNSRLKSKKTGEYCSSCPVCGGYDRFLFWVKSCNFWCRQCGIRGFTVDAPIKTVATISEIIGSKITSATPQVETWKDYHLNLFQHEPAREYWKMALGPKHADAVTAWNLGFCPDYKSLGPTVTIPVGFGGKFYVVKHRLLRGGYKAKYVTEPSGRGALLLGLDNALLSQKVVITEGEKKAIRLWLEGYTAVSSTTGTEGFLPEWDIFLAGKETFVIFDPDPAGEKAAEELSMRLGATNIKLPDKVDDWINAGGDIRKYLGEPWRRNNV